MDRTEALAQLPVPYAMALRLRDAGTTPAALATLLDVDESAVPGLLAIAEAKLSELTRPPTATCLNQRGNPNADLHGSRYRRTPRPPP